MNPFEMAFAIVVVVMIARVLQSRYRYHGKSQPPADTGETLRLREDVKALKERVQVLERVITDDRKSIDLDREIERLRDH